MTKVALTNNNILCSFTEQEYDTITRVWCPEHLVQLGEGNEDNFMAKFSHDVAIPNYNRRTIKGEEWVMFSHRRKLGECSKLLYICLEEEIKEKISRLEIGGNIEKWYVNHEGTGFSPA